MNSRRSVIVGLVLVLSAPVGAYAQEEHTLPPEGTYGLSFRVPWGEGGGAGLGFRRMLSSNRSLGMDVTLGYTWSRHEYENEFGSEDGTASSYSVGLNSDVRFYRSQRGPMVPFVEVGGGAAYSNSPGDAWASNLAGRVGVGVEWLPLERVSIAGSMGGAVEWGHSTSGSSTSDSVRLHVVRSDLVLTMYF